MEVEVEITRDLLQEQGKTPGDVFVCSLSLIRVQLTSFLLCGIRSCLRRADVKKSQVQSPEVLSDV